MEANKDKTILVTGATGRQGGAAARHLLGRGFPVAALTRNPEKAEARLLARKGARVVEGDLDDRKSLEKALKGAYGVFSVQDFWEHGREREIAQGRNLIDAAKAKGVRHFVYSSVASADRGTGLSHFESKREIEERLRASGLPFTILRPVFFMENFDMNREQILEGTLSAALPPDRKLQMIAVDDVGAFAALAFVEPEEFLGRTLEIAGADMPLQQAAEVFSEILNRPVRYVEIPLETLRQANPEAGAMYAWFREHGYEVDVPSLRSRYGFLKTFGEWARVAGWETTGLGGAAPHQPVEHSRSIEKKGSGS